MCAGVESNLVTSIIGKLNFLSFEYLNNGWCCPSRKIIVLRCWDCFSKLYWHSHTLSILKTASKNVGTFIHFVNFLFTEVTIYLYKSTVLSWMKLRCLFSEFPIVGGMGEGGSPRPPPNPTFFFETPPIKIDAPHGAPPPPT